MIIRYYFLSLILILCICLIGDWEPQMHSCEYQQLQTQTKLSLIQLHDWKDICRIQESPQETCNELQTCPAAEEKEEGIFGIILEELVKEYSEFIGNLFQSLLLQAQQVYRSCQARQEQQRPVYYKDNFASLNGGAQIIMKSSASIRNLNSILDDSEDRYMYTDEQLPIHIIVGLKEEIAINSISVSSNEMYSSIVKDFVLEGTFTLHEKQWIPLGKFRANNAFHEQEFLTERHVVRYLKLSILTSYGIWTYFTMTQLKVHGKGLFADAVASLEDSKRRKGREREFFLMADKQICGDDEDGDSENQLQDHTEGKNLVSKLINKVERLEVEDGKHLKEIQIMQEKLKEVMAESLNEKAKYREALENKDVLVVVAIVCSLVSVVILIVLAYTCLETRNELLHLRGLAPRL